MKEEDKNKEWAKRKEKIKLWDILIPEILNYPESEHKCPICKIGSLVYSWQLCFSRPRLASFDIYCQNCKEKTHFAVPLPEKARDNFKK